MANGVEMDRGESAAQSNQHPQKPPVPPGRVDPRPQIAPLTKVDQQTKDATLKENGATTTSKKRWITNTEALQLVKDAQEITGERLPVIPTSKGGKFQIVQNTNDKSFFLEHDPTSGVEDKSFGKAPEKYSFNAQGFYAGTSTATVSGDLNSVTILSDRSPTGRGGEISQELLRNLKAYVQTHKKSK